jgi:hypothetical protein
MMRVNLYQAVHVKTLESQKKRVLLRARMLLQEKAIAVVTYFTDSQKPEMLLEPTSTRLVRRTF